MSAEAPRLPKLVQGGMGVGISNYRLVNAVALAAERQRKPVLGTVSGVGLSVSFVNRMRRGDQGLLTAVQSFPVPEIAQEMVKRYWKNERNVLPPKPEVVINGSKEGKDLFTKVTVIANYAEVWQAKQGHNQPIAINYLEKVQPGRLYELLGAMLGGVDGVAMGAGVAYQTPRILDDYAAGKPSAYKIEVTGAGREGFKVEFNPAKIFGENIELSRPNFFGIVSTMLAVKGLLRMVESEVNGFIIEGPSAGGHNASPRKDGKVVVDPNSDIPVYGAKDMLDLNEMRELNIPFWLAGGMASPEALQQAIVDGAAGVQVGSIFALSNESGMREDIKREVRRRGFNNSLTVTPSIKTSPTGFPFNVVHLAGSLSNPDVYNERERECLYGFLRESYKTPEGKIASRCPADVGGVEGARCICSGLGATVNMDPGIYYIVTLGQNNDYLAKGKLMKRPNDSYTASDVIEYMLPSPSSGLS